MKVSELLCSADRWCQGCIARGKDGEPLDSVDLPEACSWCLYGALCKCYPDHSERMDAMAILMDVGRDLFGNTSSVYWQDEPERTFEEVRDLILKAGV